MGIIPDYIIGDLDSINKPTIYYFKQLGKTKIIKNTDQDKTDLELAITLSKTLNPKEINILGAIGNRIDHTLANIFSLVHFSSNIYIRIIDDINIIEYVTTKKEIKGKKDDIISIIPLSDIQNLSYEGMKWQVANKHTKFGWYGISNRLKKEHASVSFSKGGLLIIRINEEKSC